MALIKFHDVLRDSIQSLLGTNPSADEIIKSYPTAHLTNCEMRLRVELFLIYLPKKAEMNGKKLKRL